MIILKYDCFYLASEPRNILLNKLYIASFAVQNNSVNSELDFFSVHNISQLLTSPQSCHPLNVIPGEVLDPDQGVCSPSLLYTYPFVALRLRLVLLL